MKQILIFTLLLLSISTFSQKGNQFPVLTGETLEGNQFTVPEDTKGKITFIGMSYSPKAENTLKTWYQPLYDKFVLKRGMFDSMYDVNLYFIPMFTGGKKTIYEKTLKKLKESNRKDLFPYILFYKGELEPYASDLKMENKNLPYFFVLDEQGNILYATQGLYNESKMEKIEEILDSRL